MLHPRQLGLLAASGLIAAAGPASADFKPFAEVAKDYTKVVSTADGAKPLYGLYINKKTNQLLAELPTGYARQKHLVAATQASGAVFAGLQGPSRYVYWKRYDKRIALIEPQLDTRSNGEAESKSSVERLFTDRVLFDVPIVCLGPSGQPVIDLDEILVGRAGTMLGGGPGGRGGAGTLGADTRLATIAKAKAFPDNIEVAIEVPMAGGQFGTFHYSISNLKANPRYKPRIADERVGYFTTVYRDLGQYDAQKKWVRYIDRWHLEKRDPKLKLSPPKEPITFYVEHTVPVRYRRYIRQGIEYWNEAFEAVGIEGAIEVRYQDKSTNTHMDKDPEDVRYNFIRWLNNDISTAIGPHRAHPETGQILDADVVLTDGWIRAYWGWYNEQAPELAVEGMTPETLRWLEDYPEWDPRLLLASPEQRERVLAVRDERKRRFAAGEPVDDLPVDVTLMYTPEHNEIRQFLGHEDRHCMAANCLAHDMSFAQLALEMYTANGLGGDLMDGEMLDGIPEAFVGPLLAELVCHEVGHTLGLRHNFKSSSIYTMEEINSEEFKGKKPLGGSVMDYLPPNFNMGTGEIQGDFAMIGIGPYDKWAIEFGYTLGDPAKVLERVSDPELVYLTDDDTTGPDPLARRYDFTADPLTYAENQMRIVDFHRDRILSDFVKDGQSWANARRGYQTTLSMQNRMIGMMSNWVGGAHVSRHRKGDADNPPIEVVDAEKQRKALEWIVENAFYDDAFGLTTELLAHMTVDKWSDDSPGDRGDPTWPVHQRVLAVQSSALTQIMNPTTLGRVYDNEYRVDADDDAVTLAEVMMTVYDAVFEELDEELNGETYTLRKPMISSMRRNLQANLADRLVVLAVGDTSLPRPVKTLATQHLRNLGETIEGLLEDDDEQLDAYTRSHLEDLHERVKRAMERIYVENR